MIGHADPSACSTNYNQITERGALVAPVHAVSLSSCDGRNRCAVTLSLPRTRAQTRVSNLMRVVCAPHQIVLRFIAATGESIPRPLPMLAATHTVQLLLG